MDKNGHTNALWRLEERAVCQFATVWEREQGYKPAPFQKAIALQRIRRGESVRQIIDALVAQRVDMG